jgi:glycerol-3-phosphate O-acyltransferase
MYNIGAVKQKETLGALAQQLTRLINPQSLGRITIRIARPFTLEEYVTTQITQRRYTTRRLLVGGCSN